MYLRIFPLLFFLIFYVTGQESVSQCALACIRDVTGTSCNQAQWSCLCQSQIFLERASACAKSSCNASQYDAAISAIKQLCAIFQASLTFSPYATASGVPATDQIFSTVAASSSLISSPSTQGQLSNTPNVSAGTSTASVSVYPTSTRASTTISSGLASMTPSAPSTTSTSSASSGVPTTASSGKAVPQSGGLRHLYIGAGPFVAWLLYA